MTPSPRVGELGVELLEAGQLPRLAALGRGDVEVHSSVAFRGEVDAVLVPHRDDVLGQVVGQLHRLLRLEVVDPDVMAMPPR